MPHFIICNFVLEIEETPSCNLEKKSLIAGHESFVWEELTKLYTKDSTKNTPLLSKKGILELGEKTSWNRCAIL